MKRILPTINWFLVVLLLGAAGGCGSNPNVKGARFDLRNKDYQRALENINKALETEPDNAEAHVLKGDILAELLSETSYDEERTGYVGEMVGAYTQALMLDPENLSHVTRQRSRLYGNEFVLAMEAYRDADQSGGRERADRFVTAARHFRNASMILPDSVDALINEAYAYYNAGAAQEAADAFEAAIALGNKDRKLFIYLAQTYDLMAMELADSQTRPAYYREMIRVLEMAREQYPSDEEIRRLLLNAYAASDMTTEAKSFYEEIFPMEQDDPIYLYNYGTLLLRQEDHEGAIRMLQKAVVLDSSYVNALFNLGAAYVNYGVSVDGQYRTVENSLRNGARRLSSQETARLEDQKNTLEQSKSNLFRQAIVHLEAARELMESDLSDTSGVCDALYRAYAQTNQRSRAEEARVCAGQ